MTTAALPAQEHHSKRKIVAITVIILVVVAGVGGYFVLRQSTSANQLQGIELLSASFSAFQIANHTGSHVTFLLWVQNIGDKPVTSLTGEIAGIPTLKFQTYLGGSVSSSHPLYPYEIALNLTSFQSDTQFVNGTQYSVTLHAVFSDGAQSTAAGNFTSVSPIPQLCYVNSSADWSLHDTNLAYTVDSSSGKASWVVTINATTPYPLVAVVAGLNNGTLWFPFQFGGKPISPLNPLPPKTNVTQTFVWTYAPATLRYIDYVGECANQNGQTRIQ